MQSINTLLKCLHFVRIQAYPKPDSWVFLSYLQMLAHIMREMKACSEPLI